MKVKDLFCGMDVEPETAPAQFEYQGKTYYFCDFACKQMFMLNPEKYIAMQSGDKTDERFQHAAQHETRAASRD